ncbi:MAG: hypothetical protein PVG67_10830 [Desulfobacterales bacterium]
MTRKFIMQKVSFSFPPEFIDQLDHERGTLSRIQFVLQLLRGALREHQERSLHTITAEVYGDSLFAQEEERLAEDFFEVAPDADL